MSKITDIVNDIIVKTNANTSGQNIHNATEKETPVDADELVILDSVSSFSLKKLTWANLKNVIFSSPALTGTPTAPTATAGTNTTQIATTAFVKAKSEADSIGVNQTWQDVKASRSNGVTYTNTTGKPIFVAITLAIGNDQYVYSLFYINNLLIDISVNASAAYSRSWAYVVIPHNASYRLSSGGADIVNWLELR